MNKEEILARSQKENKDRDLAEIEAENKGGQLAGIVAALMCLAFYILERKFLDRDAYGYYCILTMFAAVQYTYKAIKLRGKQNIVNAALWCAVALVVLITYIGKLNVAVRG